MINLRSASEPGVARRDSLRQDGTRQGYTSGMINLHGLTTLNPTGLGGARPGATVQDKETQMTPTTKRPTFARSIDTDVLVQRLINTQPGDTVGYAELSQLVGRDVQGDARSVLDSARAILERDANIVTGTVRGVGIRHLTDTDTINTGQLTIEHVRRVSRATARRIATLKDPASVPVNVRARQYAYLSTFGAFVHMTRPSKTRKIEAIARQAMKELPLARTLEAFKD